jgi:hypothetical protein
MTAITRYDKRTLRTAGRDDDILPSPNRPAPEDRFRVTDENLRILEQAQRDWDSLHAFRQRAKRTARYVDGDQWGDVMEDPDRKGHTITEKDYIKRQGKTPVVQNILSSIVRNITGQYRNNADKPVVFVRDPSQSGQEAVLTDILQAVATANQLPELDAQNLQYLLLSGALIQRLSYSYFKDYDRSDVYIENIDYNRIFFNADVKDIRLNDLCRIGVIHDLSLDQLLSQFCSTTEDEAWMRRRFEMETCSTNSHDGLTGKETAHMDFFRSYDNTRLRVFECWYLTTVWKTYIYDPFTGSEGLTALSVQEIRHINAQRLQEVREWNAAHPGEQLPEASVALVEYRQKMEPEWQVCYLLQDGACLLKSKTPYRHQEHPFCIRCFPMIAGNVYGLVYQLIDQQRMINRTITLWDMITGAGAKGVLLVPEDVIPDWMSPEEFAEEWVRFNGVIPYKPKQHGQLPRQVTANSVPVGLSEMLHIQLQLMQDISGVHEAIQGKTPHPGVSGKLYQQETVNASLNTLHIMKTLAAFKEIRDRKILKLAAQYYHGKRRILSEAAGEAVTVDAEKIRDIDFDLRIIQNTDTPGYRQLSEERLTQMVLSQLIPPEIYFQNSSDPTVKKIYASLKKMQASPPAGAAPAGGVQPPPELAQAAQQGDPQAIQLLQQAVGMPEQPQKKPS